MTTAFPPGVNHGKDEPHFLQDDVAKYFAPGISNLPTESFPLVHSDLPEQ